MKIAYLEDDKDQAVILCTYFDNANITYQYFDNLADLSEAIKTTSFDTFVLDIYLANNESTGLDALGDIKSSQPQASVIFVTKEDSEEIIVNALKNGADDYMIKPIRHRELFARISAVKRRKENNKIETELDFPPYHINKTTRKISLNSELVNLTQKEYDLAVYLFMRVEQIIPRSELLENVWGTNPDINTRRVDTHISRLRNKLQINDANGWCLHSIYQHGYRLERRG